MLQYQYKEAHPSTSLPFLHNVGAYPSATAWHLPVTHFIFPHQNTHFVCVPIYTPHLCSPAFIKIIFGAIHILKISLLRNTMIEKVNNEARNIEKLSKS